MRRWIVTGGRDYDNYELVRTVIEQFPKDVTVVNGGADGADALARRAARELKMRLETYNAEWRIYGRAAGPIRNAYMADLTDVECVWAFPGGRGTQDMVEQASKRHIPVYHVTEDHL